ncbi:MAG: sister chromatid cohesion protein PDS5, partial [Bacteroidota bacterium]
DKAIPLLLEALQDTQPDMRFAALTTLRKILNALPDLYADKLLEGITKALGDTDQQLRILAVMTLADLGKINPDYTQKSLKALLNACSAYPWFDRSPDSDDMQQPTASAWKMPKPDARRRGRRRRSSAHSLPEMHRSALNILQAAASPKRSPKGKSPEGSVALHSAKGSHWAVRSSGNIVLGKIGLQGGVSPPQSPLQVSQAMIALLSPQLEDRNRHVRQSALSALGGIFSQHPVLVSPILKSVDYALRDADKYVRRTAVELLGQIANIDGKQAVAMGDKLCAICKDEKEHEIVRLEAVKQLGKLIRPSAHHVREVLPVLLGLFVNDIFEEDEVKIISSTIEKIVSAVPTPHTLEVLTEQIALLSEGDKKEDKHEERTKAVEDEGVVIRGAVSSPRDGAALQALYASNLGQLVGANLEFAPVIMRVLQQMASPSHPEPVAAAAVQALGQLALADTTYAPKVFDIYKHLLSRMDTIKKGKLLGAIIDALGTLQDVDKARYDQEVIELIRQLLDTLLGKQMTTTREVGYTMLKVLSKAAKGKQDNAQAHLSKLILSTFRQVVLADLPVSVGALNKLLHTLNPTAISTLDASKSSDMPYSLFGTNRNLGNTILSTHDGTLGIACQALVSVAQCSKTCADFALSVALCLTCTDYEYDTHQAGKKTLIQLLSINPSQIEGAINALKRIYQDQRYTPASIRIAAMHTVVELLKTMPKMSSAEQCFTDQQLDKRSILEELLIAIVVDKSNEVHDATLPQLVNVASTRQLIEMYCSDKRVWGPLFYTILNRLCQAPLLVSSHGDKYHFKAYDTQGVAETWEMPKRSAQRFVQAIRSKRPGGRKMCVMQ